MNDPCSTVKFTYCSKGTGNQYLIDHFILSENATELLLSYDDVDGVNNFSDHSATKCVIDNDMKYFIQNCAKKGGQNTAWHKSNEMDINIYQERVDHYIGNIHLPESAMLFTVKYCQVHLDDINQFHDDIINALLTASQESIPRAKPACSKVVPGWNEYVEEYFRSSLFWHSLWLENGLPKEGIIVDLRGKTRTQYHRVC